MVSTENFNTISFILENLIDIKMKYLIIPIITLLLIGCNSDPKKKTYETEDTEVRNPEIVERKDNMVSTLEAIANAHGYQNWEQVKEVQFTFNVDRDTTHFERSWKWFPKENKVTSIMSDTIVYTYSRKDMDSMAIAKDKAFINDKYWLFAPFQLMWDQKNYTSEVKVNAEAPISGKSMQRMTIVYTNEGGYTPGDAYDFYFEGDFKIKEWVYRKNNQKEPSMITTFENYKNLSGTKLALDHNTADGSTKLYFTKVGVITD